MACRSRRSPDQRLGIQTTSCRIFYDHLFTLSWQRWSWLRWPWLRMFRWINAIVPSSSLIATTATTLMSRAVGFGWTILPFTISDIKTAERWQKILNVLNSGENAAGR